MTRLAAEPARLRPGSGCRTRPVSTPSHDWTNRGTEPGDFRRPARVVRHATLGLIALGVLWRVARYASGPPLWGDEAFIAVNLLARDLGGMFRTLDYYQIVPLGFLGAELAVVRALGGSEWAVRLIPFLAGLVSLGLFARFAWRTVDARASLVAVGIFAASYYPVRHAVEVKPYSTDLLFGLGAIMLAWRLRNDLQNPRRWGSLVALVAVGVWFSYPLVFVAGGLGLFLVGVVGRDRSRRAVGGLGVFAGGAGLSWLGSYLLFGRPQAVAAPFYSQIETWRGAFPPLDHPGQIPGWLLDVHTGNMLAYPLGGNHGASLATALLVLVGVVRLARTRRDLLVLLLAPLGPMLAASCLRLYPYGTSARTTLFLAPSFCLLAGLGASTLIHRVRSVARRGRWARLAVVALGAIPSVAAVANTLQPYKNWEDVLNRRAVVTLAALARPGDRWLATDGLDDRLESRQAIMTHWVQQSAEVRYNLLAAAPVPLRWLTGSDAEVEVAATTGRTWLIVHRTSAPAFDEARLEWQKAQLRARLGPPGVVEFALTRGESIVAYHYDPPHETLGGRWAARYSSETKPIELRPN